MPANSEDVEITTNADVFDKLKIGLDDSPEDPNKVGLVVTFADECYVPVHVDDNSYDYDTGLYVDFDAFEVTVYAPIHTQTSSMSLSNKVSFIIAQDWSLLCEITKS